MSEAMTHEARRFCHGDDAWTEWQPCTAAQADARKGDDTFQVRRMPVKEQPRSFWRLPPTTEPKT